MKRRRKVRVRMVMKTKLIKKQKYKGMNLSLGMVRKVEENEAAGTASEADGGVNGEETETTALQPIKMYFPPSIEYKKKIKISTRCYIVEALRTLDNLKNPLTSRERKWFEKHRQFKHIFHMPRENHKVMCMWLLLLRMTSIEKRNEVWFIVNGIPIRYDIREHALISGLDCRNYPLEYLQAGNMDLIRKHFEGSIVRHQDVKEKLEEMETSRDRLKMVVLYFLSNIVIGQTKTGKDDAPVLDFFQRVVNDLKFCKTFPWGRLSFDHMVRQISHTVTHFGGVIKEGAIWPIPSFIILMELLAFEAIPAL